MQRYRLNRKTALCLLAILVPVAAWGNGAPRPGGGRERKPPQEAFDACANKDEGDGVTVTTPQGSSIKATCRKFEGQLAALPDEPPPKPPGGAGGRGTGDAPAGW